MSYSLQLLILLSRLHLSDEEEQIAQELCCRVSDWSEFFNQSKERFVLPLVYRHLQRIAPDNLPSAKLALAKYQCIRQIQHNLLLAATHRELVEELLKPLGARYLFFKGLSLASRFYDDSALRFCRDIDLLVGREDMVALLEMAMKKGYLPHDPGQIPKERTSIEFLVRSQEVISLMSPLGVLVEFHQRIDKSGGIYDPDDLLDNFETQMVGNTQLRVMPVSELFVYICLHHTRHHWSRLHWIVDIYAIQDDPEYNVSDVYRCADRHNLRATVEASLDMCRALENPGLCDCVDISSNGRELLCAFLSALKGGSDLNSELALRVIRVTPDFVFSWQVSNMNRLRLQTKAWAARWHPTYQDYLNWPLPHHWQWLYFITRPLREIAKRLSMGELLK